MSHDDERPIDFSEVRRAVRDLREAAHSGASKQQEDALLDAIRRYARQARREGWIGVEPVAGPQLQARLRLAEIELAALRTALVNIYQERGEPQ